MTASVVPGDFFAPADVLYPTTRLTATNFASVDVYCGKFVPNPRFIHLHRHLDSQAAPSRKKASVARDLHTRNRVHYFDVRDRIHTRTSYEPKVSSVREN
jgi:hypothetical protein